MLSVPERRGNNADHTGAFLQSETQTKSKKELEIPLRSMQESARRIAKICQESKLKIDETEYVASFKTELMDAVYSWCKGASFFEICKVSSRPCSASDAALAEEPLSCFPPQATDVFEGSLIRTFRRLQELIRQMAMAAKAIGNNELEDKFLKCGRVSKSRLLAILISLSITQLWNVWRDRRL